MIQRACSEGTFSLIELMVVLDGHPGPQDVAQIDVGLVELYGFRSDHREDYYVLVSARALTLAV